MTQTIRTIRIATQGPAGPAGLYPHASWSAGSVPYARSSVLAHNGGIWLALRDTSVEPSVSVSDDWGAWLDFSGLTSGVATLGEDGKIPAAQLPAIAITDTFEVASQIAMLALVAQKGDIAIRSDLSKSFVLAADDPTVLANWKELRTPTDTVLSVAGQTGSIGASSLKSALAIAAGDVSGLAPSATSDTTNAGNIATGTLSNARLSGVALTANNLSDLDNATTARTNMGLGALALLGVGTGLTSAGGNLSADVTSVAGRTGAVTLAQADISGLTTSAAPQFTGMTLSGGPLALSGNQSLASWGLNGIKLKGGGSTLTDTSAGGTVTGGTATDAFGGNTIAATNARTFDDYYSAYVKDPVAGTNVTFTRKWSLGLEGNLKAAGAAFGGATLGSYALAVTGTANISGNVQFGGNLQVSSYIQSNSDFALGVTNNSAKISWGTASDVTMSRNAAGVAQIGTTTNNALGGFAPQVKAGAFVAADFPSGSWYVGRDSSGGTVKLYYNNAGTLLSVALA